MRPAQRDHKNNVEQAPAWKGGDLWEENADWHFAFV